MARGHVSFDGEWLKAELGILYTVVWVEGRGILKEVGWFKMFGVEGRVLIPSYESTGITTNCWTIIDRRTLELTKKDTPPPKTKEKPEWDSRSGTITIKSNPITARWVMHNGENSHTTEAHPLEWRFWASHQASQPGSLAMGGGILRESDFES